MDRDRTGSTTATTENLGRPAALPADARAPLGLALALAAQELLFAAALGMTGSLPLGVRELHSAWAILAFTLGSLSAILLLSLAGLGWLSLVNVLPVRILRRPLSFLLYLAIYLPLFNFGFFLFSRHLANAQLLRDAPNYFSHAPAAHLWALAIATALFLALSVLSWRWRLFGEAWRDLPAGRGRAPLREITLMMAAAAAFLAISSGICAAKTELASAFTTSAHGITGFLPDVGMAFMPTASERNDFMSKTAAANAAGLLPVGQIDTYLKGLRGHTAPERPNIVVVMLESVPTDHVGAYGYGRPVTPNLDRLASQSLVFDRCWSVANESKHGQSSIHTSALPMRGSNDDFSHVDYRRLPWWVVFKILGYRTAYISAQNEDWLHMRSFQLSGQIPPDVYLHSLDMPEGPSYEGSLRKKDEETVNRRLFQYLDQAKADGRPFVLMTDYQRTHYPFEMPNGWTPPFVPLASLGAFRAWTKDEIPNAINSFDSALAYVDKRLGELVRHLDATGLGANTIVAVLSDHGIGFEPGVHAVSESLKDPYIHVPFLIRYPGSLSPAHFSENVSTIDLFPTLLGLLGAPSNPAWEGRDVLALGPDGCARRPVFAGSIIWLQRWLAIRGDTKVSVDFDARSSSAFSRADRLLEHELPIGPEARDLLRTLSATLQQHVQYYETSELHTDFMVPAFTGQNQFPGSEGESCAPGPDDLHAALRSLATRNVWWFEKQGMGRLRLLRLRPDGRVESLGLPDHPAESFWDLQGAQLRLLGADRGPTTRFSSIATDDGTVTFQGLHHEDPTDVRFLRQARMASDGSPAAAAAHGR